MKDSEQEDLEGAEQLDDASRDTTPERAKIGVPRLFWNASVKDFNESVVSKIPEKPSDLFIRGKLGVGKSHLSVAIVGKWWNHINHEEKPWSRHLGPKSCLWISIPDILLELRKAVGDGKEYAIIHRYSNYNVLVLDDLGAEKKTEYSLSSLYVILSRRMNGMLPTVVTTNLKIEEIHRTEPRIASRLSGFHRIVLEGKDRRIRR